MVFCEAWGQNHPLINTVPLVSTFSVLNDPHVLGYISSVYSVTKRFQNEVGLLDLADLCLTSTNKRSKWWQQGIAEALAPSFLNLL